MSHTIKVGDELYFVRNNNARHKSFATVEKVGRKWLSLTNGYRADRETLVVDGAGNISPGRLWHSKEEYDEAAELDRLWSKFQSNVSKTWRAPPGITAKCIRSLSRILRFEENT